MIYESVYKVYSGYKHKHNNQESKLSRFNFVVLNNHSPCHHRHCFFLHAFSNLADASAFPEKSRVRLVLHACALLPALISLFAMQFPQSVRIFLSREAR